jgi:hypothetical protein
MLLLLSVKKRRLNPRPPWQPASQNYADHVIGFTRTDQGTGKAKYIEDEKRNGNVVEESRLE